MKKGYKSKKELANARKMIALFTLLAVLALLIISLFIYLITMFLKANKPGLPPMQTTEAETTTQEDETEDDTSPPLEGRAGLLIFVYQPGYELEYLWLLDIDLDERLVSISAIDPDQNKLASSFKEGGAGTLIEALEKLKGTRVDRYMGFDHKDFVKAVKGLGAVNVYIEDEIDYKSNDLSLQLNEGMQKLDFNNLPNYLKYISAVKKDLNLEAELLCSMIHSYANEKNIEKSETLFELLINLSESNINAYDYFNNKHVLTCLAKGQIDLVSQPLN